MACVVQATGNDQELHKPLVNGVDDGTRTHDDWNHNPGLYQLSYTHHKINITITRIHLCQINLARPAGFEPATLGLAYHLRLSTPLQGLWSGLSLHHLRCRTYSLYGSPGQAVIKFTLTAYSGVFLPSVELSFQNTRADLPAAGSMLNTNQ